MNRGRFKIVIWLLIAIAMLLAAALAVRQVAALLAYFQDGADPASALNIEPNKPLDWPVELTWQADGTSSGRALEPVTRDEIEAAYERAWLQWHFSLTKGEPFGLATYFSGPALASIEQGIRDSVASGVTIEQADTRHDLELTFYSADGTIAAFTDHAATVIQLVKDGEGAVLFSAETTSTYDVVMMIDEGRWRVRHMLRTGQIDTDTPHDPIPVQTDLAGINYYPQDTPWHLFWSEYDPDIIAADLAIIQSLGLNSVRIFIPFEQFGADKITSTKLALLEDFLDQAEAADIGVMVTLFDFLGDYGVLRWNHTDRHLETLLTEFVDHPAVLMWDLKNEPDLDYDSNGQALVDAWLAHTIAQARRVAPTAPLTIGWSNPEPAVAHAQQLDVVSFHYYRPISEFAGLVSDLKEGVGNRPIMLTEYGLPTWNSPFFPFGHTQAEQAAYYSDMGRAIRAANLDGYMTWTLYDFSRIPSNVAGAAPWRKAPQRKMGLITTFGTTKPAANYIAPDAMLNAAPVPFWARFVKPFRLTLYITIALCFIIGTALIRQAPKQLTDGRQRIDDSGYIQP